MIVLAGLGTYLMRLLPMLYGQQLAAGRGAFAWVLSALGVAAITALIVVSLVGLVIEEAGLLRLLLASLVVLVVLKWVRNVGVATLSGALVYGLLGLALA
ncbi:hypothetical protein BGP77_15405 [Saccharospirillum sp. MSK14-1]|nr:hypothetical protein BGP77_15405 [Saccharospirillum sp. MSK14-1]